MVAVPVVPSAFVDRQEEMARLDGAIEEAAHGIGQLLLIRGEPGIGKTRLVQEAAEVARARGFAVAFGAARAESVAPYSPWREVLRGLDLAQALEDAPPPTLVALYVATAEGRLVAKAERWDADPELLRQTVSDLTGFIGGSGGPRTPAIQEGPLLVLSHKPSRIIVHRGEGFALGAVIEGREDEIFLSDLRELASAVRPTFGETGSRKVEKKSTSAEESLRRLLESRKYEGTDYAGNDPKLRQSRLFQRVALGLLRKASLRPTVAVIDDLQWADPSSLALLHHAARNTRSAPVLLVGTYRVEEGEVRPHLRDALQRMGQEELVSDLTVSGLPREEMGRLVESFLGLHALTSAFLDLLWRETRGNPLFVREVVRQLEAEGAIHVSAGAKRLARRAEDLYIPRRVRDVIRARLDRLAKGDRELLDAASACGTRFTAALVARVAGGADEHKALNGLNAIARVHGLLQPAENGFAFNHAAVQEVAYEALPPETRRTYHLEAARWLELAGGQTEDIAEHYYLARDARAVAKLCDAAEKARRKYANEEAARFLKQAIELAETGQQEGFYESLGAALDLAGNWIEAIDAYQSCLSLTRDNRRKALVLAKIGTLRMKNAEYDEAERNGQEALSLLESQECAEGAQALILLGTVDRFRGEYEAAIDSLEKGLRLSEALSDEESMMQALKAIADVHQTRGDYRRPLELYEMSLAIAKKLGDERSVARLLSNRGLLLHRLGNQAAALENLREALAAAERIGDSDTAAAALVNMGGVQSHLGDADAIPSYERAISLCTNMGNRGGLAVALGDLSAVYDGRGDFAISLPMHEESLRIREAIGDKHLVITSLGNIGISYTNAGKPEEALNHFRRALRLAREISDYRGIAWTLDFLGELYKTVLGEYDRALECFEESLQIKETHAQRGDVPSSFYYLAETHVLMGDVNGAAELVEKGLALSRSLGDEEDSAFLKRVSGMINRHRLKWDDAQRDFEESVQSFLKRGRKHPAGRSEYELGLMWLHKGDTAKASEHLRTALSIFSTLNLPWDAERVRRALQTFEP